MMRVLSLAFLLWTIESVTALNCTNCTNPFCLDIWSPNGFPNTNHPPITSIRNGNCSGVTNHSTTFCCGVCYDACVLFEVTVPYCESYSTTTFTSSTLTTGLSFMMNCSSNISRIYAGTNCTLLYPTYPQFPIFANVSVGQCANFFDSASWLVSDGNCSNSTPCSPAPAPLPSPAPLPAPSPSPSPVGNLRTILTATTAQIPFFTVSSSARKITCLI